MINIIKSDSDIYEIYRKKPLPIVLYGAGCNLKKYMKRFLDFVMVCDKYRAGEVIEDNIEIKTINDIKKVGEEVYVVVTVSDEDVFSQIRNELECMEMKINLVHACTNVAFRYDYWGQPSSYRLCCKKNNLRINIACDDESWIFRKFASKMYDILKDDGIDVFCDNETRDDVDLNHHIPYANYKTFVNDTLMITHVDCIAKVDAIKKQLAVAGVGICMSKDTMEKLVSFGVNRGKLCYINPAHDMIIRPHKYLIGITHRCRYPDDIRKRETALLEILKDVSADYFKFFIMGEGWRNIISQLMEAGFEVEYYENFEHDIYTKKMQEIDYYLYFGEDEGSMGYLDAISAGAGTIVTPQGYHLDIASNIDYPCRNVTEFHNAFMELQRNRQKKVESVQNLTWENYVKKHVTIWKYLLRREPLSELYSEMHMYNDGIYSMMISDNKLR